MLSVEFAHPARASLSEPELRSALAAFATAVVRESEDPKRPVWLLLQAASAFAVRRSAARQHLDPDQIQILTERGIVRQVVGPNDEAVYIALAPEMLVAAITWAIAREIQSLTEDHGAREAAEWLASRAAAMPLGDVLAAGGILEYARSEGAIPRAIITWLLERRPRAERMQPGRYALSPWRGVVLEVEVLPDGSMIDRRTRGKELHIPAADVQNTDSAIHHDVYPWLILSHLAMIGMVAGEADSDEMPETGDGNELEHRVDALILFEVGGCPVVLRRPPSDPAAAARGITTQPLPDGSSVAWHAEGFVEPITYALFVFLTSLGPAANPWIEEAARSGSPALLMRASTALLGMGKSVDRDLAKWAEETLRNVVLPACEASLKRP
jgi:hypothetical protein